MEINQFYPFAIRRKTNDTYIFYDHQDLEACLQVIKEQTETEKIEMMKLIFHDC